MRLRSMFLTALLLAGACIGEANAEHVCANPSDENKAACAKSEAWLKLKRNVRKMLDRAEQENSGSLAHRFGVYDGGKECQHVKDDDSLDATSVVDPIGFRSRYLIWFNRGKMRRYHFGEGEITDTPLVVHRTVQLDAGRTTFYRTAEGDVFGFISDSYAWAVTFTNNQVHSLRRSLCKDRREMIDFIERQHDQMIESPYLSAGDDALRYDKFTEAIENFEKAVELTSSFRAYGNLARAKFRAGKHADALSDINKSLRLRPDLQDTLAIRGQIYEAIGVKDKALADYTRALELGSSYEAERGIKRLTAK